MNILFDTLPNTVNIDGKVVPIKTDYRSWLKFIEIVQGYNLENITVEGYVEMMDKVISTLFHQSQNIEITVSLFGVIMAFFTGFTDEKRKSESKSEKPTSDFRIDADEIYTSFVQDYGIRLAESQMHWYEFRTLFSNLSENTALGKLIRLRTMDEEDIPKEKLAEFRQLQKEIQLPSFGSYVQDETVLAKLRNRLK